ncbi:MAG: 5'-methylthioadenosine nucleosidase [Planctomycetaceae bacterium]
MSHDDAQTDRAHADVAIVCALPIELAPFLARCERIRKYVGGHFVFRGGSYDGVRIAVVESGVGYARARRATESLITAHTPNWVLSCGFSGGLTPETKIGDLVVGTEVSDVHGNSLKIDMKIAAQPGLHTGRLLTADSLVQTVDEKRQLADRWHAIAVDLESLAVAQVCRERDTRFMAVRSISDDLSADLPAEILSVLGNTGSMRIGAALGAVWKRPGSVKDMWRLRETAVQASERLADFLDGVVKQLCPQNGP